MATSAFSRIATLNTLLPRLKTGARVFVWGFPGNGHSERGQETHLDDLNATKSKWAAGFGWQHRNTVAVNEALVLHLSAHQAYTGKVAFFGCNPGLIAHSAVLDKVHGGGCLGAVLEFIHPLVLHAVLQAVRRAHVARHGRARPRRRVGRAHRAFGDAHPLRGRLCHARHDARQGRHRHRRRAGAHHGGDPRAYLVRK